MKHVKLIFLALAVAAYIAGMVLLYKAGCYAMDAKAAISLPEAKANAGECQFRILMGATFCSLSATLLGAATAI